MVRQTPHNDAEQTSTQSSTKNNIRQQLIVELQKEFTKYVEHKNVDVSAISLSEKHKLFNEFLSSFHQSHAEFFEKRKHMINWAIMQQEGFSVQEILQDRTFQDFLNPHADTHASRKTHDVMIHALLEKLQSSVGDNTSLCDALGDIQEEHRQNPKALAEIQSDITYILDLYTIIDDNDTDNLGTDEKRRRDDIRAKQKDIPTDALLSAADMEKLNNIQLTNEDLLSQFSTNEQETIKKQPYEQRPSLAKMLFLRTFQKQLLTNYTELQKESVDTAKSIGALVTTPKLDEVLKHHLYGKDAKNMSPAAKQQALHKIMHHGAIDFTKRSKEEKQSLINAYLSLIQKNIDIHAQKMGLDTQQYTDFVKGVFDLDTKEVHLPVRGGKTLPIKFQSKDLTGRVVADISVSGLSMFEDMSFPMQFTLDPSSTAALDMMKNYSQASLTFDEQQVMPGQKVTIKPLRGKHNALVSGYLYKTRIDNEDTYIVLKDYVPQGRSHEQDIGLHRMVRTNTQGWQPLYKLKQREDDPQFTERMKDVFHITNDAQKDYALEVDMTEPVSFNAEDMQGLLLAYCLENTDQPDEKDYPSLIQQNTQEPTVNDTFDTLAEKHQKEDEVDKSSDTEGESRLDEEEDTDIEGLRESGYTARNALPGCADVPFKKGATIIIQAVDTIFKPLGGNGYITLEITDVDNEQHPTKFKYIMRGLETRLQSHGGQSWEGQSSARRTFSADTFEDFKKAGKTYKMPASNDADSFVDYLRHDITFGIKRMDDICRTLCDSFDKDGKPPKRDGENITYFGRRFTEYDEKTSDSQQRMAMFAVDFRDNYVLVSEKGGDWMRRMSFAEFTVFVADKKLRGYTDTQYKTFEEGGQVGPQRSQRNIFWMSGKNIAHGIKKRRENSIVQGKKKLQEAKDEQVEEILFDTGLSQACSRLPWVGDFFMQAQHEYLTRKDKKNQKLIEEGGPSYGIFGRDEVKGLKRYLDNHNLKNGSNNARKKNFDHIINLFERTNTKGLSAFEKKEAFAGLLYCLQKFKVPYPRADLMKYAGSNMWAKALLLPAQYRKYMVEFEKYKEDVMSGISKGKNVRASVEELAHFEMKKLPEFMKNTEHRDQYSDAMIKKLQNDAFTSFGQNSEARDEGAKMAEAQGDFDMAMQEEVEAKMREGRYGYAIGAMTKTASQLTAEDTNQYPRFVAVLFKMILGGGLWYTSNQSDKKVLRDLCRKHGIPLSEFMLDNSRGPQDLVTLLEIVTRQEGIPSFTDATGRDIKKVRYHNWSDNHQKFLKSFDAWFQQPGRPEKIMKYFHMENLHEPGSFVTLQNTLKDPREKRTVKAYVSKAVNADMTDDFDAYTGHVNDGIQTQTVLNTPKKLVEAEYLTFHKGGFRANQAESAQYFWDAVKEKMHTINGGYKLHKDAVRFLFHKYFARFEKEYAGNTEWLAIALGMMKAGKKDNTKYVRASMEKYLMNHHIGGIPPQIAGAVQEFEKFFLKNIGMIDRSMVGDVIGEEESVLFDRAVRGEMKVHEKADEYTNDVLAKGSKKNFPLIDSMSAASRKFGDKTVEELETALVEADHLNEEEEEAMQKEIEEAMQREREAEEAEEAKAKEEEEEREAEEAKT